MDDQEQAEQEQEQKGIPSWWIYTGEGQKNGRLGKLPDPPRWREFDGVPPENERDLETEDPDPETKRRFGSLEQGARYRAGKAVVDMVNTGLYLRRPLLVTGKPGTGKSSLAYSVAYELGLGPVLVWPINSRSTLGGGLYTYDAIGRLQEANLPGSDGKPKKAPEIGRFIRLGPLGTALLPTSKPRVLLIDEIDKADIDLPNDLLHVFEEGTYEIPELSRLPAEQQPVKVRPHDSRGPEDTVTIHDGRVTCKTFPFVVLTSNGERDFPPAFKRRCLRLDIKPPGRELLEKIVKTQLGEVSKKAGELIGEFLARQGEGDLATDQLLNALFLVSQKDPPDEATREKLLEEVWRYLNRA